MGNDDTETAERWAALRRMALRESLDGDKWAEVVCWLAPLIELHVPPEALQAHLAKKDESCEER